MSPAQPRKRILFFAESATLAHVARPYALASRLDPNEWEVVFACASSYLHLFPDWPWRRVPLNSVPPQTFMERVAHGRRVFTLAELKRYAEEDLQLMGNIAPDVVVGDMRLSLSASARFMGIPYVALTNAYWSPYAQRQRYPMPISPLTRLVGVSVASTLFSLARPAAFAWHAMPLNALRRHYGLPSIGADLRCAYTDADITLYADLPELVPTVNLPAHHRYLGPLEWSPALPMPALPERSANQPLIYVTMGSSGAATLLPLVLEALSVLGCRVVVAAAGARITQVPANATVVDYLPGREVSAQASLVICNGGSPTSAQALAFGAPVLGIPANLDQLLNMGHLESFGAGLSLRPEHVTVERLRAAAETLLSVPTYKSRAAVLAAATRHMNPHEVFEREVRNLISYADGVQHAN